MCARFYYFALFCQTFNWIIRDKKTFLTNGVINRVIIGKRVKQKQMYR